MANEQLAQLAALLGGGKQRFYQAGPAASAAPIVPPQQSASASDQFLARALSGHAPNTLGEGIFSASQSISNALQANRKDEKATADQAKLKAAFDQLAGAMTTGAPGALNAGEIPSVPSAAAPMDEQAAAMGLDRPTGEMTTGGQAPRFAAGDPTMRLAAALASSGQIMPAFNLIGSDLTAQRAARTKAAAASADFRRDLAKQENKGDIDRRNKTLSPEAYGQQVAINAARAGYQAGPGGGLQPIPGGPNDPATIAATTGAKEQAKADVKKKAAFPKARNTMTSLENQWGIVDKAIDKALTQIGPFTAGFGANLGDVKGTPAHDLQNTLNTIKGNIGFDKLAEMRANSPTGGALGNVTEFENRLLQSVKGSLEAGQSQKQLKTNLMAVKEDLAAVRQERKGAFQQDYGKFIPEAETQGGGAGGDGIAEGTIIDSADPAKPSFIMRGGQWAPFDG